MSRILLGWELGSGLGHAARLAPLARELSRRGHEVVAALRDLAGASRVLQSEDLRVFQAPLWIGEVRGLAPARNFAETLLRLGFHDPDRLSAVARGWRTLIDTVEPDLVLLDHAPTALLATRGLGIARASFGDGFCIPPAVEPWPAYRWWRDARSERLHDSDKRVLATANAVLTRLGTPALERLCDLYETDETFLLAFEAIDHYPDRPPCRYWGPVYASGWGAAPRWPLSGERRVFAYLSPVAAYFEPMVKALQESAAATLVYAPGVSQHTARALSSATVVVSATPYDMARICAECDAAVTQSGMGTAAALLLAGKPQLMVPALLERGMLAYRIQNLGAGLVAAPDAPAAEYRRAVKRLLGDEALSENARCFAAAHSDFDVSATVAAIADRCEAMLVSAGDICG